MSVKSENTHNVHIRKKRLLDSLKEYPELNNNGLNRQDSSDEPTLVLAASLNENFQMISVNANDNEPRSEIKVKIDKKKLEKLRTQVEFLENEKRIMKENLFERVLATIDLVHFAEELDEQEEFEEEQNIDVQEVKTEQSETKNISCSGEYQPQMQIENRFVAHENGMVCKSSNAEYQPQMQIENRFVADENGMVCKSSSAEYQPQMQIKNRFVAGENGTICKSSNAEYQPQKQIENRFVADENGTICKSSNAEYQPQKQIKNRFVADENGTICKSSNAEYQPQKQIENRFVADKNGMVCKSSSAEYQPQKQIENRFVADESGMVCIGPNGTMVPSITLASINWSISGAAITRKILVEIFGRKALAANNLTGKQSPAFIDCDKPEKGQLDPKIVADIIHFMGKQKGLTPKEVRIAITTKCADENKMLRLKEKKRKVLQHEI